MTTTSSREFARIDKTLSVRLRVLGEDQATSLALEVLDEPSIRRGLLSDSRLPDDGDATWERRALATLLVGMERLRREVDRLAALVDQEDAAVSDWIAGETVSVSGSGLAVLIPRNLDTGTLVELDLQLRREVDTRLHAIGRVASLVLPDGDRYPVGRFHLGVAFETIHDQDREALIRYTFREQRRSLRRRGADS